MRPVIKSLLCLPFLIRPAGADGTAGNFDYYLLALSWSPSWCLAEGEARGDPQCRPDGPDGFVVHGLWPQYEEGWPSFCRTAERDPSRGETSAMGEILGSPGNAWHQWQKHGRCSGLSSPDYYSLVRKAFESFVVPDLAAAENVAGDRIAAEFLALNPALAENGLVVTCRDGLIREVRLCLTRDLAPRACGGDVLVAACRSGFADLPGTD